MNLITNGAAVCGRLIAATLTLGGTLVTATAAELNKLAGVTPGTATASKAAVLGTNKNLDTLALAVSGLKIGAGAGTAVDCTAAELNTLNGVTAGAASASKAVVLDANNAIAGLTRPVATVTGDTTLTAADANKVVEINAAATKTMTLPGANAVAAGAQYTFVHQVASTSGAGHTIHPVGTDVMRGNGFTPAAAKGAVCTQGTSRIGDAITIVSNGSNAWYITAVTGTWAREA